MEPQEGRVINVRRLVALDITLHGPRFILMEFGVGTPAIILVGLGLIFSGGSLVLGWYLLLTGMNYLPLLWYAINISRKGSARSEVEAELDRNPHYVRKYSLQQLLLFVPLLVLILAFAQAAHKS